MTAYVIDSNAVDRSNSLLLLSQLNLKTRDYESPEAFLIELEMADDFPLVMIDMQMPPDELTELIADIFRIRPLSRIVLCTKKTTIQNVVKMMKLGIHYILEKPLRVEALQQAFSQRP